MSGRTPFEILARAIGSDEAELALTALEDVGFVCVPREPTEAMIDAGSWGPMTAPDAVWKRMVDKALL